MTVSSCPRETASRAAGLARLAAFVPHAAAAYSHGRNTCPAPGRRGATSCLSPYLQRRLVAEAEVIAAVTEAHPAGSLEKFVQEVLWRTYWKGWLEQHPGVWRHYLGARGAARAAGGGAERAIARAADGRTGIECFDAWAGELVSEGTLHNHVRMWFASIWIFTLGLPWAAGADFFHRHLLDGDAASNTLGWRWVAGLQTLGKHYLARADNIARFTDGRFPDTQGLATEAPPLPDDGAAGLRAEPVQRPPVATPPPGRTGLLLTPEDLSLEVDELADWRFSSVAALGPDWVAGGLRTAHLALSFGEAATRDGLARAAAHYQAPPEMLSAPSNLGADDTCSPEADDPDLARRLGEIVLGWARAQRLAALVVPAPRVGPWRDLWAPAARALAAAGLTTMEIYRRHDLALHPWAGRGFFHFKKHALWPSVRAPADPPVGQPSGHTAERRRR